MAAFIFGPGVATPLLNFFLRGITPPALPANLYFSLGSGDSTNLAELSGVERAAVPRARGAFGGHASSSTEEYPFQSPGDTGGNCVMLHPCILRVPSTAGEIVATTDSGLWIMVYDAASGGNLMMASRTVATTSSGEYARVRAGDVLQIHRTPSHPYVTNISSGGAYSIYTYCMVSDWLFRNYDSLVQLFPVASYPNIYMVVRFGTNKETTYVAVPRNTSTWGAPAAGAELFSTKVSNTAALTLGTFSQSFTLDTSDYTTVAFYLAPPPQTYDLHLHTGARLFGTLSIVAGDSVSFAAGTLDVVVGWA